MPRGPCLDYPSALHHFIVRGIERRKIFLSDRDRLEFLERFGRLIIETKATLYARWLMPNHAHTLIAPVKSGGLDSFSAGSALRHRLQSRPPPRRTPLSEPLQNVLAEEDPYFLEIVRYIHLNPVRSRLPVTIGSVDRYRWTGHAVLLGHGKFPARDCDSGLQHFGDNVRRARHAYRQFVREGRN